MPMASRVFRIKAELMIEEEASINLPPNHDFSPGSALKLLSSIALSSAQAMNNCIDEIKNDIAIDFIVAGHILVKESMLIFCFLIRLKLTPVSGVHFIFYKKLNRIDFSRPV